MKSRVTNELPPTWIDIFTHNRLNILNGEPEMQESVKLSSEWDTDMPLSQPTDSIAPPTLDEAPTDTLIQEPRMNAESTILQHQRSHY
jgi:hypothetical protein